MTGAGMTTRLLPGTLLLAAVLASAVRANDLNWEARAAFSRSDNISRSHANEMEGSVVSAGLRLNYERVSRGLDFNIDGDIEFRRYMDDIFDDDTLGFLNANLDLKFVEDVLTWKFENSFAHTKFDPFAPETPQNRERVNVMATGPELAVRIGPSVSLGASARLGRNIFSETNADNDSLRGLVFLEKALSRSRRVSLNVSANRVGFDNDGTTRDFDRQAVFVGFSSRNAHGSVAINIGYNQLDRSRQTNAGGRYVNIAVVRQLSNRVRFDLNAGEALTYTGDLLSQPATGFTLSAAETRRFAGFADPLEIRHAGVGLRYGTERGQLAVLLSGRDVFSLTSSRLNRDALQAHLSAGRSLGPDFRTDLSVFFRKTRFDADQRNDEDVISSLSVGYSLSRSLAVELRIEYFGRSSNLDNAEFNETSGSFTIRSGSPRP